MRLGKYVSETAKQALDMLKQAFENAGKTKKVCLQSRRRQFELLSMTNQDRYLKILTRFKLLLILCLPRGCRGGRSGDKTSDSNSQERASGRDTDKRSGNRGRGKDGKKSVDWRKCKVFWTTYMSDVLYVPNIQSSQFGTVAGKRICDEYAIKSHRDI
ncbi:hypothetical protein V8G54_036950 [Vigna mungo]|uniref:Uncharacterized protein n=1 Tax=Vigna mungo TaxID=3915 RepID=A0AAQ3REY5_VIGMU